MMEGSPKEFKPDNFKNRIHKIPGVTFIKELHVWSLASGKVFMTCHIGYSKQDFVKLLTQVKTIAKGYGVKHSTLEIIPDA